MSFRVTTGCALVLLLAGCEGQPTNPGPIRELPRSLSTAEQEVLAASNQFAFALFRELNDARPDAVGAPAEPRQENIFISPLSASMALGMTMNGARGATFEAMRTTLGFGGLSQHQINASYRSLIDLLRGLDPRVQMLVGNSIWYHQAFPFEPAFLDTTRTYFDAEVAGLDFEDADGSASKVNRWVDQSTKGRIGRIVEPAEFHGAVMFLINAIYFKGDWTQQFDPRDTRDAPFHDASGELVRGTVRMMHRGGLLLHSRGDRWEAADLPYGAGAFSMTVILPDRGVPVDDLIRELDAQQWQQLTERFEEANVELNFPKFRLEYERGFTEALEALGMGIAFGSGGVPNFTGMSPRGRELVISDVVQKTFVDVNEQGTEAAAVTKVGIGITSGPPVFNVDRPFIFAIREKLSGAILFLGKIELPPSSE